MKSLLLLLLLSLNFHSWARLLTVIISQNLTQQPNLSLRIKTSGNKRVEGKRVFEYTFLNEIYRSPITTGIPFLGETNYAATYKPFKVGNVPNFEEKEVILELKNCILMLNNRNMNQLKLYLIILSLCILKTLDQSHTGNALLLSSWRITHTQEPSIFMFKLEFFYSSPIF